MDESNKENLTVEEEAIREKNKADKRRRPALQDRCEGARKKKKAPPQQKATMERSV